jgi:F-type H+-transporting ATPase subunit epsilon
VLPARQPAGDRRLKTFTLELHDANRSEQVRGVSSFVGVDASGSFGILAGHARLIATLVIGLARFRTGRADWRYLAVPGAVVYFHDNVLTLCTRRYLLDDDYRRISSDLQRQLLAEERQLHDIRESLHRLEEAALKRLWEVSRGGDG